MLVRLLGALALAVSAVLPAMGQETIRRFDTVFSVQPDASVTITEEITVNALGREIQRGIFRDVPTTLAGADGRTQRMPFFLVSVMRNGQSEPFETSSIAGGRRIRIGSPDVTLPPGEHSYEIVYRMERAARLFDDYDEFYWNATGNYWAFPIESATALVTLPEGADIVALDAFTGAEGVAGGDVEAVRVSDNTARFTLTRPLAAGEGMTVSVAFAKGAITAPQGVDAARYWLSDYRDYIVPVLLLVVVIAYNALAWSAVGRDPAKGVIFPRFHPPKGFSPALTHYVHTMGWSNSGWQAFSAALISLAAKGLISIGEENKKTVFTVTGKRPEAELPPSEAVLLGDLEALSPVTVDKKSGPRLAETRQALTATVESENRKVYFRNNLAYTILGVLIGLASLVVMVAFGILPPLLIFIAAFGAVFLSILGGVATAFWRGAGIGRFFALGILGIFVVNAGGIVVDILDLARLDFPVIAAMTIIAITLVFGVLMRAPTVHGRKVMDEIDGFKMYLETAEKERLNFTGEPEMTSRRFEAILPYAMALGVEKPWSERFQNDLERHAVKDAGSTYTPAWYHGRSFETASFARTMTGVTAGLGAAMISAQPASSSSSGVGGGGFSGGGGGGGGGGGW